MSTAFDPETGARITTATDRRTATSTRRNPYEVALAVIWISSAAVAFVLAVVGGSLLQGGASDLPDPQATGAATFGTALVLAVLAVLVGVAHLTVRAIAWRPPER
jgi:cytochrome bd-type quinol oxidase subunit 2